MKMASAFLLVLALVLTSVFPGGIRFVNAADAEDGLILYYDFVLQNSFATEIPDASGNQNVGALKSNGSGNVEGTYSINPVNIYGKTVKALKLTGGESGPYLQLPNGILYGNDAVTISMWVNLSTDNGYQRIWDFGTGTDKYMYLLSDGYNDGFKGYVAAITTNSWNNEKGVQKETNIAKNRWVLTTDLTLPSTAPNGSTITWTSANSAITITDGVVKVTRPAVGSENASGKLTATIQIR